MVNSDLLKMLPKYIADKSPQIMTALGVTGVVTTAVLAIRATFTAAKILNAEQEAVDFYREEFTTKRKVRMVWQVYIPTVAVGGATVACILGANHVSTRRNAALISVYSLTETAFREYKDKVVEVIGDKKEQHIRDEVAKDRIERTPASKSEVVITGRGEVLCFDTLSGRYFQSDMETLRKAQNDINAQILIDMYASLSDFWNLVGLASTDYGEQVGWNLERMLDVRFSSHLSDDGRPCIAVEFNKSPAPNYYKLS